MSGLQIIALVANLVTLGAIVFWTWYVRKSDQATEAQFRAIRSAVQEHDEALVLLAYRVRTLEKGGQR